MTLDYPDLRGDYIDCPTGLILPEVHARARYAPREPVCIDLFCGCGGASLGIMQAGFRIIAAVDNDEAAAATYMANLCRYGQFKLHFVTNEDGDRFGTWLEKSWSKSNRSRRNKGAKTGSRLKNGGAALPDGIEAVYTAGSGWISYQPPSVKGCANFIFGDICKLTSRRVLDIIGMEAGEPDLIAASPPCQGFSLAGKRDVHDPRNTLVWEWLRLVTEIRPKSICMENVPGMASMTTPDGVPVLDQIARVLEDNSFATVNAFNAAITRAGVAGIMRHKPVTRKEQAKTKAAAPCDAAQIDLFDNGDDDHDPDGHDLD